MFIELMATNGTSTVFINTDTITKVAKTIPISVGMSNADPRWDIYVIGSERPIMQITNNEFEKIKNDLFGIKEVVPQNLTSFVAEKELDKYEVKKPAKETVKAPYVEKVEVVVNEKEEVKTEQVEADVELSSSATEGSCEVKEVKEVKEDVASKYLGKGNKKNVY